MIYTRDGWNFNGCGLVDPAAIRRAVEALEKYRIHEVFEIIGKHRALRFVSDNADRLRGAQMFENALIVSYLAWHAPTFPAERLIELFQMADVEQLREAAHHRQPPDDTITLYRGIAGTEKQRRIAGLSWCTTFYYAAQIANGFEKIFSLPNPAVYAVTVPAESILVRVGLAIDPYGGNEVLLLPPIQGEIQRVPDEIVGKIDAVEWKQDPLDSKILRGWVSTIMQKRLDVFGSIRNHYAKKRLKSKISDGAYAKNKS